ncbi:MAG: crossover junction endodeoxyribonuclease RuvC [Candidatus Binatia bacterium]|nr:MAG: crossover junction endodeoxyribonuclease RuvC [Candidatus Binatia bacterium]
MRVIGVDPSTVATGWGVLDGGVPHLRWVAHGVVRCHGAVSRRLARLHSEITRILIEHRPDYLSLEQGFASSNIQAALRLGEARGVVLAAAGSLEIPVAEYAPSTIKLAVTGDGRATKAQVQLMVQRLLALPEPPAEDAADALAAALCHLQSYKLVSKLGQRTLRRG